MRHDPLSDNNSPATLAPLATAVASAWRALCGLSATHSWFWLARTGAFEPAAPVLLVLFDGLSGLLGGASTGVCGHG